MLAKLLDVNELGALLGISKRTVEYWQASGRLPGFVRVYGHRRWRSDLIHQWIESGCPELGGCRSTQTENHTSTGETVSGESAT